MTSGKPEETQRLGTRIAPIPVQGSGLYWLPVLCVLAAITAESTRTAGAAATLQAMDCLRCLLQGLGSIALVRGVVGSQWQRRLPASVSGARQPWPFSMSGIKASCPVARPQWKTS